MNSHTLELMQEIENLHDTIADMRRAMRYMYEATDLANHEIDEVVSHIEKVKDERTNRLLCHLLGTVREIHERTEEADSDA